MKEVVLGIRMECSLASPPICLLLRALWLFKTAFLHPPLASQMFILNVAFILRLGFMVWQPLIHCQQSSLPGFVLVS
jgi:hypothetical protein